MSSGTSLNHIFRTVWNQALGAMVAVAETGTSAGRSPSRRSKSVALQPRPEVGIGLLALSVAVAWGAVTPSAHANPTGAVAIVGQATVVNNGNALQVTTQNGAGSNFSAINWQSFSIPSGSSTHFQQPNANSTSINRVVTNTPSQLFGTLSSNGSLVLVNQSGIAVGAGAVVDTAAFTASSLAMSDQDAVAGRLRFGNGAGSAGAVSVQGIVLARSGDVVLLGANVDTAANALVQSPNGSTILAAGRQIELTGRGLEGISLLVQAPNDSAVNLGTLKGGAVGVFAGTLKHSGLIQASSAALDGGRVMLKASADSFIEGQGSVLAQSATGAGGYVEVLGNRVALTDSAKIDVSGATSGGTVLVGGDYQGKNAAVQNANIAYVGADTQLNADATGNGNGGKVIVWADDITRSYGNISARGGQTGGDGGFVETSGKNYLDFQGRVNTSAVAGKSGVLLLDPSNIDISTGSSVAVTGSTPFQGSSGTSVLNEGVLLSALASGPVIVDASTGTGGTGLIRILSPLSWSSGGTLTLTTGSTGAIAINAAITTMNDLVLNSGSGGITQTAAIYASGLTAGASSGGSIALDQLNSVFGPVSLTTSGAGNALLKNSGAIDLNTSNVAGTLTLDSGSFINQSGTITANTLDIKVTQGATLTNPGNAVGTLKVLNTGTSQVSYWNSVSLSLGPITTGNVYGGDLSINTSSGNLTQSGAISAVGGLSTIRAGTPANHGSIALMDATNDFKIIDLAGSTVSVRDANAMTVTKVYGSGTVLLQSGGNMVVNMMTSLAAGDAISLLVGGTLSGAFAPDSANLPNGRWLAYLGSPGGSTFPGINGGGVPEFKQYGASYGSTILGTGPGVLYSVTPSLFATLSGVVSKTYDGTTSISPSGGSVVGLTGGGTDDASLAVASTTSATLTDPNVGTGKQVTFVGTVSNVKTGVSDPVGSGKPVYGYSFSALGNIGTVTQAVASVSLNGSRAYDGSNVVNAGIFSMSGLAAGETLTLTGAGTVADKNVGTNKPVSLNTLLLGNGTGLASNYTFNGGTHVATITKALVTGITGVTAVDRAYDGTTVAALTTSGAVIAGVLANDSVTLASAKGSFDSKNVGVAKRVNISDLAFGGADAGNYAFTSATAGTTTATITKALVTGVTGISAVDRAYDGTTVAALTTSGAMFAGMVANDDLTLTSAKGTFDNKNVGVAKKVTITDLAFGGADLDNYSLSLVTASPTSATVTKALVSGVTGITAADRVYDGTTVATLTISGAVIGGIVANDSLTLASATGSFDNKNVGVAKKVTITDLAFGGTDAGNYTFSSATASTTTATITQALVTKVTGITAADRAYDGTTAAALTTSGAVIAGMVANDNLTLASAKGSFDNKNVGVAKNVTVTDLVFGGADAGNYAFGSATASLAKGTITKALLTGVTGIAAVDRAYDGTTVAALTTSGAVIAGMVANDNLTLASAIGSFDNKNVGVAKKVTITELAFGGSDAGNYAFSSATPVTANITQRPLSTWKGPASGGNWNDIANWDALPDAFNVAAVSLPAAGRVVYDASMGSTNLQSLLGGGNLALFGGSLTVANGVSLQGYQQTGGALATPGAITIASSFSQSGGAVSAGGAVSITQASGDLVVGAISAPSIDLKASGGISQTAGLVTAGLLTSQSGGGTVLNSSGNRVGALLAASTGAGNIEFTNVGVLDVRGMRTASGSIVINNRGGISTSGPVVARGGKVTGLANSPLTIGKDGVSADGDIVLTATNVTSAGDIVLNGPIESFSGGVVIRAANNLTQNSSILAPLGVSVSAGGTMTFGPLAIAGYQPVTYLVNNVPTIPPRPPASSTAVTDQIASLMQSNPGMDNDRNPAPIDILLRQDKERDLSKELIVSEGPVCRP